jgi:hypothetical protein
MVQLEKALRSVEIHTLNFVLCINIVQWANKSGFFTLSVENTWLLYDLTKSITIPLLCFVIYSSIKYTEYYCRFVAAMLLFIGVVGLLDYVLRVFSSGLPLWLAAMSAILITISYLFYDFRKLLAGTNRDAQAK